MPVIVTSRTFVLPLGQLVSDALLMFGQLLAGRIRVELFVREVRELGLRRRRVAERRKQPSEHCHLPLIRARFAPRFGVVVREPIPPLIEIELLQQIIRVRTADCQAQPKRDQTLG